jgi:hypothetical protein
VASISGEFAWCLAGFGHIVSSVGCWIVVATYRLDLSTMCGRPVGTEVPICGGRSSLPGVIALPGQPDPLNLHASGVDGHTRTELAYEPQVAFEVRAGARHDVARSSMSQGAKQY